MNDNKSQRFICKILNVSEIDAFRSFVLLIMNNLWSEAMSVISNWISFTSKYVIWNLLVPLSLFRLPLPFFLSLFLFQYSESYAAFWWIINRVQSM